MTLLVVMRDMARGAHERAHKYGEILRALWLWRVAEAFGSFLRARAGAFTQGVGAADSVPRQQGVAALAPSPSRRVKRVSPDILRSEITRCNELLYSVCCCHPAPIPGKAQAKRSLRPRPLAAMVECSTSSQVGACGMTS